MAGYFLVVAELRQDGVGQLLAQLHSHLVERVDVPYHPLHEDFVLVQGDEGSQGFRGHFLEQEGVGRFVAREGKLLFLCRI